MHRIVQIVERSGQTHQISMTAQRADFYLLLATFKAATNPAVTFHDIVLERAAKTRQA